MAKADLRPSLATLSTGIPGGVATQFVEVFRFSHTPSPNTAGSTRTPRRSGPMPRNNPTAVPFIISLFLLLSLSLSLSQTERERETDREETSRSQVSLFITQHRRTRSRATIPTSRNLVVCVCKKGVLVHTKNINAETDLSKVDVVWGELLHSVVQAATTVWLHLAPRRGRHTPLLHYSS